MSRSRQNDVHSTQKGADVKMGQVAVDLDDVVETRQVDLIEVHATAVDEVKEEGLGRNGDDKPLRARSCSPRRPHRPLSVERKRISTALKDDEALDARRDEPSSSASRLAKVTLYARRST